MLAHHQAVDQLHKDITANAELAAIGMNTKLANRIKNAATADYIADVKNTAAAKIADNNNHAAELHQVANAVASGNVQIQTQANNMVNNAAQVAAQELHTTGMNIEIDL